MDKNLKMVLIIGGGAVGVYLLYKYLDKEGYLLKWGIVAAPGAKPPVTGGTGPAPQPPAGGGGSNPPAYHPPASPPSGGTAPRYFKPSDVLSCPAGQVATWLNGEVGMRTTADMATCHALTPAPGVTPVLPGTVMDQIQNAALAAGETGLLNTDQWCYYAASQGVKCPDPGDIDPALYEGAWGPGADRTTPIAVDTFWYLITQTDPAIAGWDRITQTDPMIAGLSGWLT